MLVRGLDPANCITQVGVDDGQKLLKFMMSVKEKDDERDRELPVVKPKKAKYSEGFAPRDFKFSGAKKVILLLVSPSTAERHDNLAKMMALLKLEALHFAYSLDIKMILILTGK